MYCIIHSHFFLVVFCSLLVVLQGYGLGVVCASTPACGDGGCIDATLLLCLVELGTTRSSTKTSGGRCLLLFLSSPVVV